MFNKTKDYAKKKPVRFGLLLAALGLFLFWGVGAVQQAFKVTDPNDPRFDPMMFEFTDYDAENEKLKYCALLKAIPLGSDMQRVRQIFIQNNKIEELKYDDKHYSYIQESKLSFGLTGNVFNIYLDNNLKTKTFTVGETSLYGDQNACQ